jgi:hypothetical protein
MRRTSTEPCHNQAALASPSPSNPTGAKQGPHARKDKPRVRLGGELAVAPGRLSLAAVLLIQPLGLGRFNEHTERLTRSFSTLVGIVHGPEHAGWRCIRRVSGFGGIGGAEHHGD